jgi:ferric-dicitrate binding protein FerR (iron transport regulator)
MNQSFDIETLLLDDSFIQYCLGKADEATTRHWTTVSQLQPDTIAQAREIVLGIYNWGATDELNLATDSLRRQIQQPTRIYRLLKQVSVAAAVFIAAGAVYKLVTNESMITLSTAAAVKKVVLSDSSVIWMNAKTTIQYAGRKVILKEGEIFCEVQHDVNDPFTVTTATGLEVADIGTSFQVRSYKDMNEEKISVTSGVVMVKDQLLHEGEGMNVNKATRTATRIPATAADISWMQQTFVLQNVPLSELLKALQEHYHIRLIAKHKRILSCYVTVSFTNTDRLHDILDNLTLIYGITYNIQQDEIILDGKGCN